MRNIAIRHRMLFAMIAVLVICFLAAVGASITNMKWRTYVRTNGRADGRLRCTSDWTHFKSYCYFVSKERKPWDDAQKFCEKQEGELVEITSFEENEYVFKLVNKREPSHERVWIGLKYDQEVNKVPMV
ncbi:unnamed protein product [Porites lobata]|uniref:C-type lectin domain-containing protein n=1 Tax=Porites lobata TaxID=104759 RepID=A0ABN8QLF5_9CNID|nr:unnamed protein product [Porites lobata]